MTITALALLLSLGLDTFAVAVGLGVKGVPRTEWLKIGLMFAVFEGMMPVLGLLIGRQGSALIGVGAGYLAGAILLAIGVWEIREAVTEREETDELPTVPAKSHRRALWLTALSVSLDELAIGFTLGLLHVRLGWALAYIAAQAFAVTFVGLHVGARASTRLGERSELAAGILLAVLGAIVVGSQAFGFGIG